MREVQNPQLGHENAVDLDTTLLLTVSAIPDSNLFCPQCNNLVPLLQ